jgi:indoleamine 2,3-dioxygenase
VSVAIEARGAPALPLMLQAISAARIGDRRVVTQCLQGFAEILDEVGIILQQINENCDPYVFYHRIRPFLAGSSNMGDAGLPNGLLYDDGSEKQDYRQYGGGSNAQSSLIQFFDIVLGIEHRPTGVTYSCDQHLNDGNAIAPKPRNNFIQEMRQYMPGPHRRFLEHVGSIANIRKYVEHHPSDKALCIAYDACLAMLRALRDKHIQIVSRYIIIQSRNLRTQSPSVSSHTRRSALNLATVKHADTGGSRSGSRKLRGTGGTSLIPFLKQARDETGEPAVDSWVGRLLRSESLDPCFAALGKTDERSDGHMEVVGRAGVWTIDDTEGGICHW